MSADARLLVDLDLGPAHRSRLTAVSELLYYAYCRVMTDRRAIEVEIGCEIRSALYRLSVSTVQQTIDDQLRLISND